MSLESLGRFTQILAFMYILINGCFLDSVDLKPFIFRIIVAVIWIVFVQLLIEPIDISFED